MTTQEDVLLREVDEDLNQERQLKALRRYGPWAAGVAVLFLAAIGVVQFLGARQAAERAEAAMAYDAALEEEAGAPALLALAPSLPGGYEALARLRGAALLAQQGDVAAAVGAYGEVYGDDQLPQPLRDYARVRAAYLAVGTDPAEAASIAAAVESDAFLPFAQEATGLAAMAQDSFAAAEAAFRTAANDPTAPSNLAGRASSLAALAAAAQAGIALEAPKGEGMATSDILELFGNMQEAPSTGAVPAAEDGALAGQEESPLPAAPMAGEEPAAPMAGEEPAAPVPGEEPGQD